MDLTGRAYRGRDPPLREGGFLGEVREGAPREQGQDKAEPPPCPPRRRVTLAGAGQAWPGAGPSPKAREQGGEG